MQNKTIKYILTCFLLIGLITIYSCENNSKRKHPILSPGTNQLYCFQAIEGSRKFTLNIYTDGEALEGIFNFSINDNVLEKGLFEGNISGDTIWGAIHFPEISDTLIDREVAFLMSDKGLIEGNGILVPEKGILVFSDKKSVSFHFDGLLLTPSECE